MKNNVVDLLSDGKPILKESLEKGVNGITLNDGTIVVDKNLSPIQQKLAISHEKVHRDQIIRGDLSYDDENVYWKGKSYPRKKMKEGSKSLEWEKEAYKKQ
tara:strand:- start:1137 stop:1439 length:303 start_codon:yes stop_codon:yes gene_type:complete